MPTKPNFTLRDLFWLILVVAMSMAWWVDRRNHALERQQILNLVRFITNEDGAIFTTEGKTMWIDLENGEIAGVKDTLR